MTFEERCKRFVKNSKNEHNRFKFVYRVIFLNKKIMEYEKEENDLSMPKIKKERPKEKSTAKQITK